MGALTGRPYGQDGGVVQLPLAIDRILAGQTPYGADYSDSMLGREARVSGFWTEHGGNPILHHHAYLPGTHFLMIPFAVLTRATLGFFDPRLVTLLACAAAGILALRLGRTAEAGLAAAAAVWVNPLVYWQQIFGANDVLVAALLLLAVHLARRSRSDAAAAVLGLACATKQLAWPFAPFLIAHLSGAGSLRGLFAPPARRALLRALAITSAVFLLIVLPVAALDFRAFWGDIVVYNAGLPGGDNYPLGGTPGLGLANILVYGGAVASLRDYVPLARLYLLLVPAGTWLLRAQLRRNDAAGALVAGSAALLLSLYVSRVMHPNYLVLAAVLLPAAAAAGATAAAGAWLAGLALLATAVEIAEGQVFATTWVDAAAARWPAAGSTLAALAPRAGPALTRDPLGLLFSAIASFLGIALVVAAAVGARRRGRAVLCALALTTLAVVPTLVLVEVGRISGTPRVQDGWAAAAWPSRDGGRPLLKEAWSVSFRKDPPGSAVPDAAGPFARGTAAVLRALGVPDPRLLGLLAIAATAIAIAVFVPRDVALTRLAGSVLLPPALLGVVFGANMLVLALAVGGAILIERRRAHAGITAAVVAIAVAGLAFGRGSALPVLEPGLGLSNLRLYAGAEPGRPDLLSLSLLAMLGVATLAAAPRLASSSRSTLLASAAAALIAAVWLAPSVSPDDVAAPIALLAFAATVRGIDTPRAALLESKIRPTPAAGVVELADTHV